MAHRTIEMLIGRLLTDEGFRASFLGDPQAVLQGLRDRGLDITATEMAALIGTDRTLWSRAADELDPRLQKASLAPRERP